jgi:hypothetical protein
MAGESGHYVFWPMPTVPMARPCFSRAIYSRAARRKAATKLQFDFIGFCLIADAPPR